jgi:hypothetical protein
MILLCKKKPVPNSWFSFPFPKKNAYFPQVRCHRPPVLSPALPLNLTYIWLVSFETVIRELALYKLLTVHVPNLISIFRCLDRLSKESVQVRGSLEVFVTSFFCGEGLLTPRQIPKLEDHPLSFVRGYLCNIFATNLHSWRPFLHPQPEDSPCCGGRDPPNMALKYAWHWK